MARAADITEMDDRIRKICKEELKLCERRMNNEDFTKSVLRTARLDLAPEKQLNNILFGLAGETGEVIDCYKKQLFQGHPTDLDKIRNEVGDVLYYLFWLAHNQGFTIEECMQKNREKLERRYPVSFDASLSVGRKE